MTTFERLKDAMQRYEDSAYTEVSFPMIYKDQKIGFTVGKVPVLWSGMSNDGRTYILYRLGTYVNRKEARQLSPAQFVRYVNQQRTWQESEEMFRKNEKLIVASHKGVIEGLLTNYNPISHQQVVEMVEKSSIYNRLTWFTLTPKEMALAFASKYLSNGRAEFGLAIRNGETGHVTLGYHLYVRSNDYVFFIPLNIKRRHLSKVTEAYEGLEGILNLAAGIEMDQVLENTSASEFLPLLSAKKFDKIQGHLVSGEARASALINALFSLRDERGYKTLANKALDICFKHAFELANQ